MSARLTDRRIAAIGGGAAPDQTEVRELARLARMARQAEEGLEVVVLSQGASSRTCRRRNRTPGEAQFRGIGGGMAMARNVAGGY